MKLTKTDQGLLQYCSVERFLNHAIDVGGALERGEKVNDEDGSVLRQDGEDLKNLICKLWNAGVEACWLGADKPKIVIEKE